LEIKFEAKNSEAETTQCHDDNDMKLKLVLPVLIHNPLGSDVVIWMQPINVQKHTVRCRVLADQGLADDVEGCSAKHCEEPRNTVMCSVLNANLR
jgi:hypothetical protein